VSGARIFPALPLVALLGFLAAHAENRAPTIGDLAKKSVDVRVDEPVAGGATQARERYQQFLELERGDPALRAEAMRRLGDLKLEAGESARIEKELAQGSPLDTTDAIILYSKLYAAYPHYERNDAVLYQLARAYEADLQGDKALATLDLIVKAYPNSPRLDEVQFRRGEMLFSGRRYADAQAAYGAVVAVGPSSEFYRQSLYKHGWALFKQGDGEAANASFAKVLDLELLDPKRTDATIPLARLPRAQRELVEDTLRVMSITFSYEEGAKSVDAFLSKAGSKPWAALLYATLGDLYVSKERYTDAADTYRAFGARDPDNDQAPVLQNKAIEAYRKGGFAGLVLDGKREFVERYRLGSSFWSKRADVPPAQAAPEVVRDLKANTQDLAAYYHEQAQASKRPSDYQEAVRWYREFLQSFPDDAKAPDLHYLLADTLFESHDYHAAALEYERDAYGYPAHGRAATAGYAALVAYEKAEAELPASAKPAWHRQGLESGVHFAITFESHPESIPVLVRAAREYYDLKDYPKAIEVADLVLARRPPVDPQRQRIAWTVIANAQFDQGEFAKAEGGFLQVLSLAPAGDKERPALEERLAAAVYKQGEARQASGDIAGAVTDYLRVAVLVPTAQIRATAEYDAAALLIQLQDWPRAIDVLEKFRRNFPASPRQPDVTRKLAVAYVEAKREGSAAVEFERMANAASETPDTQREALAQAASLYEKAGQAGAAAGAWRAYVKRFPRPFMPALEARQKLADFAAQQGDAQARAVELRAIVDADRTAGAERSDRSRYLAAKASLELAAPSRDSFLAVRLVIPLKKSLVAKKTAMQQALKEYAAANDYAVAEVSTAATYETAELYRHLAEDLLKSERPKNMNADELEQYNLLLEEQAYPFEEKAIEVHLVNVTRAAQGLYDDNVKRSYAALARLKPARFAKTEQGEDYRVTLESKPRVVPTPPALTPAAPAAPGKPAATATAPSPGPAPIPPALVERFRAATSLLDGSHDADAERSLAAMARDAPSLEAPALDLGILYAREGKWAEAETALNAAAQANPEDAAPRAELGLVYRALGRFNEAASRYAEALEAEPDSPRVHRNFGVLLDLYLDRPADALAHYERSLALSSDGDKQLTGWIAELRTRLGTRAAAQVAP